VNATILAFSPPIMPNEGLVDMDQISAMVHLSKRSMERYKKQMPAPARAGRRGRRALWRWPEVRPWLEAEFKCHLPETFPGSFQ
jgi:hypothetical protein